MLSILIYLKIYRTLNVIIHNNEIISKGYNTMNGIVNDDTNIGRDKYQNLLSMNIKTAVYAKNKPAMMLWINSYSILIIAIRIKRIPEILYSRFPIK